MLAPGLRLGKPSLIAQVAPPAFWVSAFQETGCPFSPDLLS